MRKILFAALGVVLLCPAARRADAWDGSGHMTVADVAWTELGKDESGKAVRKRIEQILSRHPYRGDIDWAKSPTPEQVRESFAKAATWPDHIKRHPEFDFFREYADEFDRPDNESPEQFELALRDWHFRDVKIRMQGGALAADPVPTLSAAKRPGKIRNAFEALEWLRRALADNKVKDDMHAIAICWIAHLVGDLHQPLHCATLVTPEHPTGDVGGNSFHIPLPTSDSNLHSLWDDLLDPAGRDEDFKTVAGVVEGLDPAGGAGPIESGSLDLDAQKWIEQGAAYAASDAYSYKEKPLRDQLDSSRNREKLLGEYTAAARGLAQRRALVAGLRLAAILKEALVGAPPPALQGAGALKAAPAKWSSDLPVYDHVVVILEENKDFDEIIGPGKAAYINGTLKAEGALLTQMFGEEHHSQGNYFWLFSGGNQDVGFEDAVPTAPIDSSNLAQQLIAQGKSFAGYSEGLPSIGFAGEKWPAKNRLYARKHAPWISFSNVPNGQSVATSCNLTFDEFPKTEAGYSSLPTVSFVIPNLKNDMHDGKPPKSVTKGDTWLEANLGPYYKWAKEHRGLLILTFDENDDQSGIEGPTDPGVVPSGGDEEKKDQQNRVATIFAGWRVKPGYEEKKAVTHVNILRTLEAMYGLTRSGAQQSNAATAGIGEDPITEVFTK